VSGLPTSTPTSGGETEYVKPAIAGKVRTISYVETYLTKVLGSVPKYSTSEVVVRWRILGVL